MPAEFHNLEESLKNFLVDAQSDSYNSKGLNVYKYNNLKIFMDKTNSIPNFVIRLGISEAVFSLASCEKLSGGLGSDERYIRRWYERGSAKANLDEAWAKTIKFETVSVKEDVD